MINIILFDTETTGMTPEDKIIWLAMKKRGDSSVLNEYFYTEHPISLDAMSVNHIQQKQLEGKKKIEEYKEYLESYFKDSVLVAHNAPFDLKMLRQENIETPTLVLENGVTKPSSIDTLKVAQDVIPGLSQYKLQYLRYYFGFNDGFNPHDAVDDVRLLEVIFEKLYEKTAEKYNIDPKDNDAVIKQMIGITVNPVFLELMPIGKYKGQSVSTIPDDTLQWYLAQPWIQDPENENLLFTIQSVMNKKFANLNV